MLLHWGLHPLLTACTLIALDLLDKDDCAKFEKHGIDLRLFADKIEGMRNRDAMAEIGLGALDVLILVGAAGPVDWLPTDYLGLNDLVLRTFIAGAVSPESLSSLGRAGWLTTLSEEELAAAGLTAAMVTFGHYAAPFANAAEEVLQAFWDCFSRKPRPRDLLLSAVPWLAPVGLALAEAAETAGVGGSDGPGLLAWIGEQYGEQAGLYGAAILALKIAESRR